MTKVTILFLGDTTIEINAIEIRQKTALEEWVGRFIIAVQKARKINRSMSPGKLREFIRQELQCR